MADFVRERIDDDPRHFTDFTVRAPDLGFQFWLHYYFFLIDFGVFTEVFLKVLSQTASATTSLSSMRSLYLSGILPFSNSFSNPSVIQLLGSRIFCLMSSMLIKLPMLSSSGPRFFP